MGTDGVEVLAARRGGDGEGGGGRALSSIGAVDSFGICGSGSERVEF